MTDHEKALPISELTALAPTAWLSPRQAGLYVGLSPESLNQRRFNGTGPRYAKVGRLIRYRKGDLDAWLLGNGEQAA
ncbi:helix-turn-helix transcriptional regulator [Dyella sp. Tek66A03]|uniref:helix-turn-helix transcriptional regulator n=1 Tax=Dyella sp. Tek66A03 TaxID=3458298 RepID=UPI00403EED8B